MDGAQPPSDKPPSERESSDVYSESDPIVDGLSPLKRQNKTKVINYELFLSAMQLSKRRLLKTSGVLATTATIAGCSGGQSSTDSEPQFELQEVQSLPSIAQSEEEITAAATIENTGNGSGSTSIEFSLDVNESTVETGTINPGDTTQITADIQVPIVDSGRYDLTASLNDQISVSTPVDVYQQLNRNGLHGSVVSETGESLVDSRIHIISTNQEFASNQVSVDSTERFFLEHLKDVDYDIQATFYAGNNSAEFNEIPDIAPLQEKYTVTNDIEILEQYEVPQGYRTEIRLVDQNENPITTLQEVSVRDQIGNGTSYSLNEEGYLIQQERSEQGVVLPAGSTFVVDAYPEEGDRPVEFGEVHGSSDEEFVFEVSNPEQFPTE